jgi:Circadian oscillating protein COP23/Bacterial pre-peptidase C-terminal domain
MQEKLLKYLTRGVLSAVALTAPLCLFSQMSWAQNQNGFYCDSSQEHPIMIAVVNGQQVNLITFNNRWTPPPYTPQTRCETVSARFQAVYLRGGNNAFDNLAFGYLNNQPVMCISTGQRGVCNPNKLLLTFRDELQACQFVPLFAGNLTRRSAQETRNSADTAQFNQECERQFADTAQRESTQAERNAFISLLNSSGQNSTPPPANTASLNSIVLQEEGNLSSNTPTLDDGSHYQVYEFQGRAGQTVAIAMESGAFDPYVLLWNDNNQKIAENDDASSTTLNSLLALTLPYTGTYRVVANALEPNQEGRYRLTIRTDSAAGQSAVAGGSHQAAASNYILWKEDALDQNSPKLESDGSSYQTYIFQGRAGQSVSIDLTSSEFNTYLILLNSSGEKIDENDDLSRQSSNSSLTLTLPYTGEYRVVVNAYDRSGRGSYLLTVR